MNRWLQCLVGAGAAIAATVATAAAAGGPAVWVIDGGRNRIYLTGSVHLLRPGQFVAGEALERAYREADKLVMEIDLDGLDEGETAAVTARLAVDPAGRDLMSLLGPEAAAVTAAASAAGLDLAPFARFEPWFVGLTVTTVALLRQGLAADAGVEQLLMRRAERDRKPIEGLETLTDQLAALDALPPPQQARFLRMSLEEMGEPSAPLEALLAAWQAGDDASLARELAAEFADFPELYTRLIVDRNRAFARGIAAYAGGPDDVLVIIGALHLVGDDNVLDMLAERGLRARRLPAP